MNKGSPDNEPVVRKGGVLPMQRLKDLVDKRILYGARKENISPASIDLALSGEIYRVSSIFLPTKDRSIRELLNTQSAGITAHSFDLPLERDVVYCARLNEIPDLPSGIHGHANPKSSTGRDHVHVRLLADYTSRYDSLPAGYKGELWALISPRSFSVKLVRGQTLLQLRLFDGYDSTLDIEELQELHARNPLVYLGDSSAVPRLQNPDHDNSILLTVDLNHDVVGWRAVDTGHILDMTQGVNSHIPDLFFERVAKHGDYIRLRKGEFYILTSQERVRIPPGYACEMETVDHRTGEFRTHFAGFIDSGWGYGKDGEGHGRQLTLEVVPFEDLILNHGQPVAKIRLERMLVNPTTHYDQRYAAHYLEQHGPRLSKYFIYHALRSGDTLEVSATKIIRNDNPNIVTHTKSEHAVTTRAKSGKKVKGRR